MKKRNEEKGRAKRSSIRRCRRSLRAFDFFDGKFVFDHGSRARSLPAVLSSRTATCPSSASSANNVRRRLSDAFLPLSYRRLTRTGRAGCARLSFATHFVHSYLSIFS